MPANMQSVIVRFKKKDKRPDKKKDKTEIVQGTVGRSLMFLNAADIVPGAAAVPRGTAPQELALAAVALACSYGITRALDRWAPVPFLRPWWSTAREPQGALAPAQ